MKSILIVDDEREILTAFATIFTDEGYEVRIAADGAEALDHLASCLPDIIVLDVLLPKISGIDVLRSIRASPKSATRPVIMISGLPPNATMRPADWNAFLVKPFDPNDLVRLVASMLAR